VKQANGNTYAFKIGCVMAYMAGISRAHWL